MVDKVQNFVIKYGFLPSIDNRKIIIRSFEGRPLLHTALNSLLQANGSIVAKRSMLIADDAINKLNLNAFQVVYYHDELLMDCDKDCSEEVGEILINSMKLAGEYYKLNIPIAGEYKIGNDWGIH